MKLHSWSWAHLGFLALMSVGGHVQAQHMHVNIQASQDSTVFASLADGSAYRDHSDGGPSVWVSTTAGDVVRRGLLRFDLSAVPAGAQIQSVRMTLFQLRSRQSHAVAVHRVLASWQGAATSAGGSGHGVPALVGDVTWSHRRWPSLPWQSPGGDIHPQPSSVLQVGTASNSTHTWPSTAQWVADVQRWLDQPETNHGIMLIGDELNSQSAKRLTGADWGSPAQRPVLHIEYTLPSAADDGDVPLPSWALVLLGAALVRGLVRGRRG